VARHRLVATAAEERLIFLVQLHMPFAAAWRSMRVSLGCCRVVGGARDALALANRRLGKWLLSCQKQQLDYCSSSLLKNPRQNESSLIQLFYRESMEARMRGAFTDQGQLFSYISPEARVRTDHPLRKIRKLVRDVLGELSLSLSRLYASEG